MSESYQIVVCGGIVPDPLQTLEPVAGPAGPSLKNEMMLPAILDPWAAHALYEAAHLAKAAPGSKVWLVSLGPKAKLQQVMMTVAQKVPFELVALDGAGGGFTESAEVAAALADAIQAIPGLDRSRLLVFGGWESASRGAGSTFQQVGERLGIVDQFQGVDELTVNADGSLRIL
ncbi:MAG TPA: electron transfer flavoprotein subunit beta, partial [Candidatus Methylomirabilis sp.]